MTDVKYNGWTNYETWLTNLWYDDFTSDFNTMAEEGNFDHMEKGEIKWRMAEFMQATVEEHLDYVIGETSRQYSVGFLHDLANSAIQEVDWHDIADHYLDDVMEYLTELKEIEEELCGAVA